MLEDTVEELEQERAAAMSQAVDEEQQHKVQEALDWFAAKMSVFSKEEQEAINACAIAFAERDLVVIPKVSIAVNTKCSQADLMAYASSAFFKIGNISIQSHNHLITNTHNTFNKQRETKQKQNIKKTTFSNFPCFLLFLSFPLVSFCGFTENSISSSNCISPQTIPNDLPTTESLALSLLTKRERYTRMLAWFSVIAMS